MGGLAVFVFKMQWMPFIIQPRRDLVSPPRIKSGLFHLLGKCVTHYIMEPTELCYTHKKYKKWQQMTPNITNWRINLFISL